MRLRHFLLSLGLSAPVLATAAATDFVAGWQAVMAHSPAYAASVAQAQAGQTKAEQGRALWRPQVLLNAGAGWASQRTQMDGAAFTAPGFGTSQDVGFRTQVDQGLGTAVTLMVQQPLLGGSRRANAEQLAAMARLAALQGQAERQALIWRLVDTHLQVLQAQDAVRIADAEAQASAKAADAARERYQTGASPVTAVHEAQARHDMALAQRVQSQQTLNVAQLAYRQLTGLASAEPRALAQQAPTALSIDTEAQWQERARTQGLAARMAEESVALARAEVEKHQATSPWSLDLVGRVSDERIRGDGPYATASRDARVSNRQQWLGLQLQVPLYTGGMQGAQAQEAALNLQAALARQLDVVQLQERDVRAAWLGVQSAQAQWQAATQALRSAQDRRGATQTGFDVGHRTMLELLDAERDWLQAERQATLAQHQALLSRLRLDAMAGTLDESSLERANAWLRTTPMTTSTP